MLHQEVKKYLLSLPTEELMNIINSAYDYTSDLDHIITFTNTPDTFRELFVDPYDAVKACALGEYNFWHEYIVIDQVRNIYSYTEFTIREFYERYIDEIAWVVIENDLLTEDVVEDLENNVHEQIIEKLEQEGDL